jgi:sterol desaturase/sphingolipid hydroxylase (fatty acid hydroxylase superfamily)
MWRRESHRAVELQLRAGLERHAHGLGLSKLRRTMTSIAMFAAWVTGSCLSAELLGYWLHRLMHSGAIAFLSRNHMKHHLVFYGPRQEQRSKHYHDATDQRLSLGNVGLEWLTPAAIFIASMLVTFHLAHVQWFYQLTYFLSTLAWSFLMFSYLHDALHVRGIWLERSQWLKKWFASVRRRHDTHHCHINDSGLMDKNFGIGIFVFDRLFGTLCEARAPFNVHGFKVAQVRFKSLLGTMDLTGAGDPESSTS